jgi:hypothetical protein
MSTFIIFFGKSQDFTTCYYDRNNPIDDFNAVIKDFDLLESKVFTVDDIKNKEILSRYFFTAQGKSYCLLKLYSFAQAFSGNRIAGSIYGVGLLSDNSIHFSNNNLDLLRVAKDNFAKLSLDGAKFNKSNFKDDTDRIWKAIVSNNNGNLLDKIDKSSLKINRNGGQVAFYVNGLFADAVKLNDRISNQDSVYLSEDLDHLKRTQSKWGKDDFPVYWEQNNQFVLYKEPVIEDKPPSTAGGKTGEVVKTVNGDSEVAKLRVKLSDSLNEKRILERDFENLKYKQKWLTYIVYFLSGGLIVLLLYLIFFRQGDGGNPHPTPKPPVLGRGKVQNGGLINVFLSDNKSLESGIVFLKSVQFIYSFDVKESASDSSIFHKEFQNIKKTASNKNIPIDSITNIYLSKCDKLKTMRPMETKRNIPESGTRNVEKGKNRK